MWKESRSRDARAVGSTQRAPRSDNERQLPSATVAAAATASVVIAASNYTASAIPDRLCLPRNSEHDRVFVTAAKTTYNGGFDGLGSVRCWKQTRNSEHNPKVSCGSGESKETLAGSTAVFERSHAQRFPRFTCSSWTADFFNRRHSHDENKKAYRHKL